MCSHNFFFQVIFAIPVFEKLKVDFGVPDLFECCITFWNWGGLNIKKNVKKDENCSLKHLQV